MNPYYYPPPPPHPYVHPHHYYAGAAPGVRLGSVFDGDSNGPRLGIPSPPGWHLGDVLDPRGRAEAEAWGTTLKIALVLGGIAAAYFLYQTVKAVGPVSKKTAQAAGGALVHMAAARRRGGTARTVSHVDAEFIPSPSSSRSPRWLTKYEGE